MTATTENPQTPKQTLQAPSPEARECLIKYFAAKPLGKPLDEKEFASIKDFVDRKRGGFTKEAYAFVKEDKELVKAAAIHQAYRTQRVMDSRAPEARHTLLKALRAPPGEKRLSLEEFKTVAVFLDPKNGGLRRHAYQIFKDDKEVTHAAEEHRSAWPLQDHGKDPSLEQVKRDTENALDAVRPHKSFETSTTKSAGQEIGE